MNPFNSLKDISTFIFNKDLSEGASCNVSFQIVTDLRRVYASIALPVSLKPISGKSFAITSTGCRIYELIKDPRKYLSIVKISNDGFSFKMLNRLKPSSEILCHLLSYSAYASNNRKCSSIVHVHPKYSLALATGRSKISFNAILDKTHTEFKYYFPNGVGFIKRTEPGTLLLAERNAKEILKHNIVLWENHGLISAANSFYECYDMLDTIESISKISLLSR